MKTMISFLLFILLTSCSHIHHYNWDREEVVLYMLSIASSGADMYSTNKLINKGGQEENPLLGNHPSGTKLISYWVLTGLVRFVIADHLPSKWRKIFLGGSVICDSTLARRNEILYRQQSKNDPLIYPDPWKTGRSSKMTTPPSVFP